MLDAVLLCAILICPNILHLWQLYQKLTLQQKGTGGLSYYSLL